MERTRKLLASLAVAVSLFQLNSCTSSTSTTPPPTPEVKQGVFKDSAVEFGAVTVGKTAMATLQLMNSGNDTAVVTSLKLGTTGNGTLGVVKISNAAGDSTTPLRVAPGTLMTLTLQCSSYDVGNIPGNIRIGLQRAKDSLVTISTHATGVGYKAQTGDQYTFNYQEFDTTGVLVQAKTIRETVTSTDTTIFGKSGVMSTNAGEFTKFESNGDISVYYASSAQIGNFGASWITLPFSTRSDMTLYDGDTTAIYQGGPQPLHMKITSKFIGMDSLTVGSATLFTYHAVYTVRYDSKVFGWANIVYDYYYSPLLGYFALRSPSVTSNITLIPVTCNRVVYTATAFTLH